MDKITELKAAVYDLIAQKQYIEIQMQQINEEIRKLISEQKKESGNE